jgi:hypothetical protein
MDLPSEVEEFLKGRDEHILELVKALRDLIQWTIPDLIEQVDRPADMLAYGTAKTYKGMVCVITINRGYVNLGFPRGAELDAPPGLLEGTGKKARHVKIRDMEEVNNTALVPLLEQSARFTS